MSLATLANNNAAVIALCKVVLICGKWERARSASGGQLVTLRDAIVIENDSQNICLRILAYFINSDKQC